MYENLDNTIRQGRQLVHFIVGMTIGVVLGTLFTAAVAVVIYALMR